MDDVDLEVPVVVGVHVHEDHVEILQHVVEDREVAAVEQWMDEDHAQTMGQSDVVGLTMSGQPCQNLWAMESESSMSSEAKSSGNASRRAGET